MAGSRQPPKGEQPALQSLRRGWLGGWRLSALVIGAVAIGLVYVGRFGLPDLLPAAASPSPSATSGGQASATPSPTPADEPTGEPTTWPTERPSPSFVTPGRPTPTSTASPTPPRGETIFDRYWDGIPGRIGKEAVIRPLELRKLTTNHDVLVGGWFADGRLGDDPGTGGLGWSVNVVGPGLTAVGPVVFAGRIAATYFDCLSNQQGVGQVQPSCPLQFEAREVVWSGDPQTDAVPISAAQLVHALADAFSAREPWEFDTFRLESARVALNCPIAWPRHTYVGVSGPIELLFVFSTPTDRLQAEPSITRSQYPLGEDAADPECPQPVARITGRTRWLVDGNVMLLIRSTTENTRLARQALAAARQQSDQLEPLWRPVTTWQALRALWQVVPDLDIAPAAEEVACVLDFPVETWALRHPQLRALAVFESRDARREFQELTDATTVRLERGGCTSLGGQRPIDADARWVGAENILLLVTGPPDLDPIVQAAIPRSRVPYR